jgi:hypothetical protein
MAAFRSSDFSYHGYTEPLASPPGVPRRSLALYYYTRGRPEEESAAPAPGAEGAEVHDGQTVSGGGGAAKHDTLWQTPPGKCAKPPE